MKRRSALFLVIAVLAAALSGCMGRAISFTWEPIPIELKPGQEAIEGSLTVKASGLFNSIYIDTISATVYDDQENVIEQEIVKVDREIPIFFKVSHTELVTIPVGYDDVKTQNIKKLVIVVTGDDPSTLEIEILLAEA